MPSRGPGRRRRCGGRLGAQPPGVTEQPGALGVPLEGHRRERRDGGEKTERDPADGPPLVDPEQHRGAAAPVVLGLAHQLRQLQQHLRELAATDVEAPVDMRVDKRVTFETVSDVMAWTQQAGLRQEWQRGL